MKEVLAATFSPSPLPEAVEQASPRRWPIFLLGLTACVLMAQLHHRRLTGPMIWADDFSILEASWTWPRTCENFWKPANEHTMPLGRITTWLLVRLAGRMTNVPLATGLQGVVGILAGMVLLYFLVRREVGRPFVGLLAMALFGVTAIYQEAVTWFAASFQVLALDTTLLGLLAVQRWRQTGRWPQLALAALWCCLAPMWFASGILAGPLCALYLLPRDGEPEARPWRRRALALVPLMGCVLFLAISLPFTWSHILSHLHNDGRLAKLEATRNTLQGSMPWIATDYTCRALVGSLLLGNLGIAGMPVAWPWVALPLLLLIAAAVWWWHRAPRKRLLLLGAGSILLGYLLTFAGRSHLDYEFLAGWSRYHLFAQLGVALFLCGGLRTKGKETAPSTNLTRRQALGLLTLLLALVIIQTPRTLPQFKNWAIVPYDPVQYEEFQRIEDMDERCRQLRIDGDTARAALGHEPLSYQEGNSAWDYLRGSDDPRALSIEEARARLQR